MPALLISSNMKITLSIVLFATLLSNVYSTSFRTRVLERSPIKYNCTGFPKKCDCPYPCLEQFEKQDYCIAKKCYKVDENLGQCKKSGTDHVAPLVLQAIPFTGVFGSGFANMGRWDLFGIYMGVLFGNHQRQFMNCQKNFPTRLTGNWKNLEMPIGKRKPNESSLNKRMKN